MSDLTLSSSRKKFAKVVIVGRPNVGKSTLLNRIIGRRKAITDPTPGVTRDPIEVKFELKNRIIKLIDTGGFTLEKEGFDTFVVQKSVHEIEKADLVVLLMDIAEVTAEDEAIIEILRQKASKVIIAVNKIDNEKREMDLWNFYSFGFEDVVGISAVHGRNIPELLDLIYKSIDFDKIKKEKNFNDEVDADISIAILGKPNTGKSTLANQLTQSDKSIVSEIPGTTRDTVEGLFQYKDKKFKVLDTAGIRKKKKVTESIEYYSVNRAIKSIDDADIVFMMVDTSEGLSEQDKKISSLIVKKGKGVILVLNKWDLMPDVPNQFEAVEDRIKFLFPVFDFAPVIPISALTGDGVEELLKTALKVSKELRTRIETAQINKCLEQWVESTPPKGNKGRYKVRYMTQTSVEPVEFLLFVNRKKGFHDSYVSYIKNRIRKELGFSMIPVKIDLRD